jgi:hypothetical protein
VLVLPDLGAANIAYKLLMKLTDAVAVGPILLNTRHPVSIVQRNASVEDIVNLTAITVIDAQEHGRQPGHATRACACRCRPGSPGKPGTGAGSRFPRAFAFAAGDLIFGPLFANRACHQARPRLLPGSPPQPRFVPPCSSLST